METAVDMRQQGIRLSEAGEKRRAAQALIAILRENPANDVAWLQLAACVETEEQRRDCLVRALKANPDCREARQLLEQMDGVPVTGRVLNKTAPLRTFASARDPLAEARQDEAEGNYAGAYARYTEAIEAGHDSLAAWLGKGFCAAMLSTPGLNRVREFADCLYHCAESTELIDKNHDAFAGFDPITNLDPSIRCAMLDRLARVSAYIRTVTTRCTPGMANIYRIEQAHLADWIYRLSESLPSSESTPLTRAGMLDAIESIFVEIAESVKTTTRGVRARRELLQTFQQLLTSNLPFSDLGKDPEMQARMAKIMETLA